MLANRLLELVATFGKFCKYCKEIDMELILFLFLDSMLELDLILELDLMLDLNANLLLRFLSK